MIEEEEIKQGEGASLHYDFAKFLTTLSLVALGGVLGLTEKIDHFAGEAIDRGLRRVFDRLGGRFRSLGRGRHRRHRFGQEGARPVSSHQSDDCRAVARHGRRRLCHDLAEEPVTS
jgi:hypothetical protein